jgi:hypothetical protein
LTYVMAVRALQISLKFRMNPWAGGAFQIRGESIQVPGIGEDAASYRTTLAPVPGTFCP